MSSELLKCRRCDSPQIGIDRFGERLVGCIECNRWTWPDSVETIFMSLPQDDLAVLKSRGEAHFGG